MVRKILDLLQKKCKLVGGEYVRGQMPKNANVICEGSLTQWDFNNDRYKVNPVDQRGINGNGDKFTIYQVLYSLEL